MPELFPLQFLLATFAGWGNRHQAQAIDYLVEENRVLEEQLGGRRLRLTDDQRRRLAAQGKILGRRLLAEIATIVTPDTILAWHRDAAFMAQVARNLTDHVDGFLRDTRYLVVDRHGEMS